MSDSKPAQSEFVGAPDAAAADNTHAGPYDRAEASEEKSRSRLDRIAQRAYEIYVARGGDQGTQLDDWLEAEREIDHGDAA